MKTSQLYGSVCKTNKCCTSSLLSGRSHGQLVKVSKNRTLELTNCQECRWIPVLIKITTVMCKVFRASEM